MPVVRKLTSVLSQSITNSMRAACTAVGYSQIPFERATIPAFKLACSVIQDGIPLGTDNSHKYKQKLTQLHTLSIGGKAHVGGYWQVKPHSSDNEFVRGEDIFGECLWGNDRHDPDFYNLAYGMRERYDIMLNAVIARVNQEYPPEQRLEPLQISTGEWLKRIWFSRFDGRGHNTGLAWNETTTAVLEAISKLHNSGMQFDPEVTDDYIRACNAIQEKMVERGLWGSDTPQYVNSQGIPIPFEKLKAPLQDGNQKETLMRMADSLLLILQSGLVAISELKKPE